MLSEIRNARQVEGEGFRRWFTDDYFDLIVWYGNDRRLIGFQLCYDKQERERALTWTLEHGFQHNRIDSGELSGESCDGTRPPAARANSAAVNRGWWVKEVPRTRKLTMVSSSPRNSRARVCWS